MAERLTAPDPRIPLLLYAVWVPGKGWLKHEQTGTVFADLNREVAETAAKLSRYGVVYPVDRDALFLLEKQFLAEEARQVEAAKRLEEERHAAVQANKAEALRIRTEEAARQVEEANRQAQTRIGRLTRWWDDHVLNHWR